jgi:hypothetical protein
MEEKKNVCKYYFNVRSLISTLHLYQFNSDVNTLIGNKVENDVFVIKECMTKKLQ